jgi:DNA-directed RNA polymerase sigma subunit (sigma70/sigma32)
MGEIVVDHQKMLEMIANNPPVLDPVESEIFGARMGLYGLPPKTLVELGQQFDLPPQRIRQIESRCVYKLKRAAESALGDFPGMRGD